MKKIFLCLLLAVFAISVNAQNLTLPEVESLLQKMEEKEIISASGKKHILESFPCKTKMEIIEICGRFFFESHYLRAGYYFNNMMFEKYGLPYEKLGKKSKNAWDKEYKKIIEQYPYLTVENNIIEEDAPCKVSEGLWVVGSFDKMPIYNHYIHHKRSTTGKTRSRTLNEILDIGLIDNVIHQKVKLELLEDKICNEVQLFNRILYWLYYLETYPNNKNKQVKCIQEMQKKGVITEANMEKLLVSYKPYTLKETCEVLDYCENIISWEISKLPSKRNDLFAKAFKDVQIKFPYFSFQSFSVELEKKETLSYIFELQAEGKKYKYIYEYRIGELDLHKNIPNSFKSFHKVFNMYLSDKQENVRLHSNFCDDKVTIISLTNEQAQIFEFDDIPFRISSEELYDNNLSPTQISRYIEDYEKIGLFTHLNNNEKSKAKTKAIQGDNPDGLLKILQHFPKVIASETFEDAKFTKGSEVVKRFLQITRGALIFTDIIDSPKEYVEGQQFKCSFKCNGKKYQGANTDAFSLVISALKDSKVEGQFYRLYYPEPYESFYIYLTPPQYEYLKEHQPELFSEK